MCTHLLSKNKKKFSFRSRNRLRKATNLTYCHTYHFVACEVPLLLLLISLSAFDTMKHNTSAHHKLKRIDFVTATDSGDKMSTVSQHCQRWIRGKRSSINSALTLLSLYVLFQNKFLKLARGVGLCSRIT